jgi:hypothetical protein
MHGTSRNPAYRKLRKADEVARECETLKIANALLRTKMVDDLHGRIATLRDQNRRLNEEADRLAEMVRLT